MARRPILKTLKLQIQSIVTPGKKNKKVCVNDVTNIVTELNEENKIMHQW